MTPLVERMMTRVKYQHGCWEWTGARDPKGYGYARNPHGTRMAHRIVYEALVGPIPDGLVIDHLCRNPSCVNPDHMEVVAQGENVARGTSRIPDNAVKTHCPAGHEYTPENTYYTKANGYRACRKCCARSARDSRARKRN